MSAQLMIREFHSEDVERLSELHRFVESLHRLAMPKRFREPPRDYLATVLKEIKPEGNTRIFVAEAGGLIQGFVKVMIKEHPAHPIIHPGRYISVEELSVAPEARRQGVGARLMEFAEDFARRQGFQEIELNVWKFNADAESFYQAIGYQPVRVFYSKKLAQ